MTLEVMPGAHELKTGGVQIKRSVSVEDVNQLNAKLDRIEAALARVEVVLAVLNR